MVENLSKKKIGDLLLEKGYLNRDQLEQGLNEQTFSGKRLGETLVEMGFITEEQLLDTVSERLSIPKLSLASMIIDPEVIQKIPVEIARRFTLLPIFELGNTLTIAMADPLNVIALDEIKYRTGLNIKRAIATVSDIKNAIDEFYTVADSFKQIMANEQNDDAINKIEKIEDLDPTAESSVARLVDLLIIQAVKEKASDIHIEPDENRLRIRYRIDGIMREEASPPKNMHAELVSRIKVASNLDVSEKRIPQDGRFTISVEGLIVDLRVSTLPTIHGEKIVIRILDRRNLLLDFKDLGFNEAVENSWTNIINKPEGLILITGPTSSGKTSTLYATLQDINSIEKNMITVEDPVEYSLPLIIQIQINEKAGLTFPSTLRAMLRQNPDIIMIGEIRDTETARMAIRSALTGHLVFSTIHTNDAPSTIMRLIDMGIENYLVATALKGVLAQRLVRLNCPDCTDEYMPSELLLKRAGILHQVDQYTFKHGAGCQKCKNSGYKGLTGIYEFVEITPEISELIMRNASVNQILETARSKGYKSLFEAGLEKLKSGTICLEELLKETSNVDEFVVKHDDNFVVSSVNVNSI
ncbi:MAG: ATPase, T2SS/T4P/T4SS family [bacterium]